MAVDEVIRRLQGLELTMSVLSADDPPFKGKSIKPIPVLRLTILNQAN